MIIPSAKNVLLMKNSTVTFGRCKFFAEDEDTFCVHPSKYKCSSCHNFINFLSCFVTINFCDPETDEQSMDWRHSEWVMNKKNIAFPSSDFHITLIEDSCC